MPLLWLPSSWCPFWPPDVLSSSGRFVMSDTVLLWSGGELQNERNQNKYSIMAYVSREIHIKSHLFLRHSCVPGDQYCITRNFRRDWILALMAKFFSLLKFCITKIYSIVSTLFNPRIIKLPKLCLAMITYSAFYAKTLHFIFTKSSIYKL